MQTIMFQPHYRGQEVITFLQPEEIIKESEKAICFNLKGDLLWFPKAALKLEADGTWIVKNWFEFCDRQFKIFVKHCFNPGA